MHDRPTIPELLCAVIHLLDHEVVPTLSGSRQFYGRVAANVLRIVSRELEHAEDHAAAEWHRLNGLLSATEQPVRQAEAREAVWRRTEELCARIRNGEADSGPYREQVVAHLKQTVYEKLTVSNPRWIERPVEKGEGAASRRPHKERA